MFSQTAIQHTLNIFYSTNVDSQVSHSFKRNHFNIIMRQHGMLPDSLCFISHRAHKHWAYQNKNIPLQDNFRLYQRSNCYLPQQCWAIPFLTVCDFIIINQVTIILSHTSRLTINVWNWQMHPYLLLPLRECFWHFTVLGNYPNINQQMSKNREYCSMILNI